MFRIFNIRFLKKIVNPAYLKIGRFSTILQGYKINDPNCYFNFQNVFPAVNQIRLLSKKNNSKKNKNIKNNLTTTFEEDDEDYEDLEESDNEEFVRSIDTTQFREGFKIIQKYVPSLRVDSILASGLNLSRKKIDDNFYSGKLRLNGEKILKKSYPVKESDRVDLIGDMDEKHGKRTLKRVLIYKIFDEASKNNKSKVVLITWKTGLFEEDTFKTIYQ